VQETVNSVAKPPPTDSTNLS